MLDQDGNFTIFRVDRASRGGGILTLVPKSIKARQNVSLTFANDLFECLTIELFLNKKWISLSTIYRKPVYFKESSCLFTDFRANLCSMARNGDGSIILGDLNLPGINWALDLAEPGLSTWLLTAFRVAGLVQLVNKPTRGKNILDLCFISNENLIRSLTIEEPFGSPLQPSDHNSILVSTNFVVGHQVGRKSFLNFNKTPWHKISDFLSSCNWEAFFETAQTADSMVDRFTSLCQKVIKLFVPKYKITKSGIRPQFSPLVNRLRNIERRLRRRHHKNINDYYSRLKITRLLRRTFSISRSKKETSVLRSKNPKIFWRYVNSRLKLKPSLPVLSDDTGNLFLTDSQKVDALAGFFKTTFSNKNFVRTQDSPDERVSPIEQFDAGIFDEQAVQHYLSKLPSNSAASLDGIPNVFLKKLNIWLAKPLSKIFNVSYYSGCFPKLWKVGKVIPIQKQPTPTNLKHFRPITLNSTISKVMEKVIRDRFLKHLVKNGLLSREQFGFLPGRSVELQLNLCMEDWTRAVDSKVPMHVFYLDVSKAFDSVNHQLLVEKLKNFNTSSTFRTWIRSYLGDRSLTVSINESLSNTFPVPSGVPQGSVLGPLLFTLFINDLPKSVRNSQIKLYADDVKLYKEINSNHDLKCFQDDIRGIVRWADQNLLNIAKEKCALLQIGPTTATIPQDPYIIDGWSIPMVVEFRDLGVSINQNLCFKNHIERLVSEASRTSACIRRSFTLRDVSFMVRMFKTFVRPKLEYCSSVWSPSQVGLVRLVESVQKTFTKYLGDLYQRPYLDRCRELDLCPLSIRRALGDLTFVYKLFHGHFAGYNISDLYRTKSSRIRRNIYFLSRSCHTSNVRNNFISNRVVDLWNALPISCVQASTTKKFRKNAENFFWKKPMAFRRYTRGVLDD